MTEQPPPSDPAGRGGGVRVHDMRLADGLAAYLRIPEARADRAAFLARTLGWDGEE